MIIVYQLCPGLQAQERTQEKEMQAVCANRSVNYLICLNSAECSKACRQADRLLQHGGRRLVCVLTGMGCRPLCQKNKMRQEQLHSTRKICFIFSFFFTFWKITKAFKSIEISTLQLLIFIGGVRFFIYKDCVPSLQYLSSSTRGPPGWCRTALWTPGPRRSAEGGERSAELLWCGSPLFWDGWAAAPPGGLLLGVWSLPWECWPSQGPVFSQPCWKTAREDRLNY